MDAGEESKFHADSQISCIQPPVDYKSLTPEDQQLFGKFVHDLLKQKGMTLDRAQQLAYQKVCVKSLEGID